MRLCALLAMQSPELLLKDLNRALLDLNAATVVLNDKDLAGELKDVTRRLVLAEVLAGTWIVAIGGSQGAGKTTLILSMYGLEGGGADWLNPNEGRGERLPVLILEDDACKAPRGALRELGPLDDSHHRFGVVERDVDVSEFQGAICNANTNVVLPVLYVPRTYFRRRGQAFLLLPGYERLDRDNAAWQQLMRQALVGAAGSILVTDETRLAGQQQTEILRDMLAKDMPDTHPLIVISKTEGLTSNVERMSELRTRAAEVFQVPPDEVERRVHCIGASDAGYKAQWLPKLKHELNDMAIGGLGSRSAQLARLQDVLQDDLGQVIKLARTRSRLHFGRNAGDDGGAAEVVSRVLESFDEAKGDLEEKFKAAIAGVVSSHGNAAWNTIEKTLIDEYEGIFSKFKGMLDTVSEKHRRLVADIETAWRQQGNVLDAFAAQTAALTHKRLAGPSAQGLAVDHTAAGASDGGALTRLGYVDSDGQTLAWGRPTGDDLRNMQVLLGASSADASLPALATKELESTVRLLPALALEYARMASLMPALVGVNPQSLTMLPASDVNAAMQSIEKQFSQMTDISKSILRGVAMVTAIDIGMDGQIDTLPALIGALTGHASATTVTSTAAAGGAAAATGGIAANGTAAAGTAVQTGAAAAGMSVAAAVVGVVAVGYLAHSALQEVRRHDGQVRSVAQQMLASISDHHHAHFMSHFNQLMNQLRQHLQQRLHRRYRLDEQLMTQDRLAKALSDVVGGQRDLLEQLALSGKSLLVMSDARA